MHLKQNMSKLIYKGKYMLRDNSRYQTGYVSSAKSHDKLIQVTSQNNQRTSLELAGHVVRGVLKLIQLNINMKGTA